MWCRSPRAAERTGRTSSPAASPATAARADALPSRPACISPAFRSVPTRRPRSASRSGCATRRSRGATTSTGTSSSTATKPAIQAMPVGRLTSVRPLWAIEGGRVTLEGDGFPVDPVVPHVRVGTQPARLAAASASSLTVLIPEGLEGGSDRDPRRRAAGRDGVCRDRRAARHRRPSRGQPRLRSPRQSLRHVQRIARPAGAGRDLRRPARRHARAVRHAISPTRRRSPSIATDGCSSRAGSTAASIASSRTARRRSSPSDLGVACGLAFGPDGRLYVGDRSGSILRVEDERQGRT